MQIFHQDSMLARLGTANSAPFKGAVLHPELDRCIVKCALPSMLQQKVHREVCPSFNASAKACCLNKQAPGEPRMPPASLLFNPLLNKLSCSSSSVQPHWLHFLSPQAHTLACHTACAYLFLCTLHHNVLSALGVGLDGDDASAVVAHGELPYLGAVVLADAFLLSVKAYACVTRNEAREARLQQTGVPIGPVL
eukprot:1148015-Pelagomonas_calceolata.AAC.4